MKTVSIIVPFGNIEISKSKISQIMWYGGGVRDDFQTAAVKVPIYFDGSQSSFGGLKFVNTSVIRQTVTGAIAIKNRV